MGNKLFILIVLLSMLTGCSSANTNDSEIAVVTEPTSNADTITEDHTEIESTASDNVLSEGDEATMKVIINGMEFEAVLDSNVTVDEITEKLPLDLSLVRYAGHEYYAELPYTPVFAEERTSQIKAGHIYYWDGWNAFVINYEDYDIEPYKVVHIGEITDPSVSDMLRNAEDEIEVIVEK